MLGFGIGAKIIALLLAALGVAGGLFGIRRMGVTDERNRAAAAGAKKQQEMHDAADAGPRTGDDAAERLRGHKF